MEELVCPSFVMESWTYTGRVSPIALVTVDSFTDDFAVDVSSRRG